MKQEEAKLLFRRMLFVVSAFLIGSLLISSSQAQERRTVRTTDGVPINVTVLSDRFAYFTFETTADDQPVIGEGTLQGAIPFSIGLPDPSKLWDLAKNAIVAACAAVAEANEPNTSEPEPEPAPEPEPKIQINIEIKVEGDNNNIHDFNVATECKGGSSPD